MAASTFCRVIKEKRKTKKKIFNFPDTLKVLPSTPQIKGLHTYIRNRDTPRDEFIFYSKRLIRLVIEYSLSLLPFQTVTVDTPQGEQYEGRKCTARKICG